MTTEENKHPEKISDKSEDELMRELMQEPVQFTKIDQDKLDARNPGDDFEGSLIEFDRTFQWIFKGPDHKVLVESSTGEDFTGVIHIKDDTLDPATYSNKEQVVSFEGGQVKNIT